MSRETCIYCRKVVSTTGCPNSRSGTFINDNDWEELESLMGSFSEAQYTKEFRDREVRTCLCDECQALIKSSTFIAHPQHYYWDQDFPGETGWYWGLFLIGDVPAMFPCFAEVNPLLGSKVYVWNEKKTMTMITEEAVKYTVYAIRGIAGIPYAFTPMLSVQISDEQLQDLGLK